MLSSFQVLLRPRAVFINLKLALLTQLSVSNERILIGLFNREGLVPQSDRGEGWLHTVTGGGLAPQSDRGEGWLHRVTGGVDGSTE